MSTNFKRPESGIHTIEGNVAGRRAASLAKQREAEQAKFESLKEKIHQDSKRARSDIHSKFDVGGGGDDASQKKAEGGGGENENVALTGASMSAASASVQHHPRPSSSAVEKAFRERTIGLVTAEEYKKAAKAAADGKVHLLLRPDATEDEGDEEKKRKLEEEDATSNKKKKKKKKKKGLAKVKAKSVLSFIMEDDDDNDEPNDDSTSVEKPQQSPQESKATTPKISKDPTIDTSFLPDKQRDLHRQALRNQLQSEWLSKQAKIQTQSLEITYSYWDGTGHRRSVKVKQGDSIGVFLEKVREDLSKEKFREMTKISKGQAADALLYVKEDLIIPSDITFYDLIATKARGKSGPLFHFGVFDDVRLGAVDVRVEKDESHPGKVVERRWYERNKHIFPASRWEVYDPSKEYGVYTIHGGEVQGDKKKKKK